MECLNCHQVVPVGSPRCTACTCTDLVALPEAQEPAPAPRKRKAQ